MPIICCGNPITAEGYYEQGMLNLQNNELEEAKKDFDEAIRRNEKYVKAYYQRALLNERTGAYSQALQDSNKVLTLDQGHSLAKEIINRVNQIQRQQEIERRRQQWEKELRQKLTRDLEATMNDEEQKRVGFSRIEMNTRKAFWLSQVKAKELLERQTRSFIEGAYLVDQFLSALEAGEKTFDFVALHQTRIEATKPQWTIRTKRMRTVIPLPGDRIAGAEGGIIKVINLNDGTCEIELRSENSEITSMVLLANGFLASIGSWNRASNGEYYHPINIWNLDTGQCEAVLNQAYADSEKILVAFQDGRLSVVSPSADSISVWDIETKRCSSIKKRTIGCRHPVLCSNGQLATFPAARRDAKTNNYVYPVDILDLETGKCVLTFSHETEVTEAAALPNNRLATKSNHTKEVKLWNIETGECEATHDLGEWYLKGFSADEDGRLVSGGYRDWKRGNTHYEYLIKLWDIVSGTFIGKLTSRNPIASVIPLPNGKLLTLPDYDEVGYSGVAYDDGAIELWDIPAIPDYRPEDEARLLSALKKPNVTIHVNWPKNPHWNHLASQVKEISNKHSLEPERLSDAEQPTEKPVLFSQVMKKQNPLEEQFRQGSQLVEQCINAIKMGRKSFNFHDARKETIDLNQIKTVISIDGNGHVSTLVRDNYVAVAVPYYINHQEGNEYIGRTWTTLSHTEIQLWNLDTGQSCGKLNGHEAGIQSLLALSDGRLVSGADDNTIKLWNIDSKHCESTFTGHADGVEALVELPASLLASASKDSTIKLWDIHSQKCTRTFTGHSGGVNAIALLLDGKRLASVSSDDKTMKIWLIETGQCDQTLQLDKNYISAVTSLTDDLLAISYQEYREHIGTVAVIGIWNLRTAKCELELEGHFHQGTKIIRLSDERLISSAYETKLWNIRDVSGECLHGVSTPGTATDMCEATLKEDFIVGIQTDGNLVVSNVSNNKTTFKRWAIPAIPRCSKVDEQRLLTAFRESEKAFDVFWLNYPGWHDLQTKGDEILRRNQEQRKQELLEQQKTDSVKFGTALVEQCVHAIESGSQTFDFVQHFNKKIEDTRAKSFTLPKNIMLMTVLRDGRVAVVFRFDNSHVAMAHSEDKITIFDLESQNSETLGGGSHSGIGFIATLSDGRLASIAFPEVSIWNVVSMKRDIKISNSQWRHYQSLVELSDAKLAIAISSHNVEESVEVWDLKSEQCVGKFSVGTGVYALALMSGNRLVTGGHPINNNYVIKIWDIGERNCIKTINSGHQNLINKLIVLPGGARIVSVSADTTIKILDVDTEECEATLSQTSRSGFATSQLLSNGYLATAGDGMVAIPNTTAQFNWDSSDRHFLIRLWNLNSGECVIELKAHTGLVNALAPSEDGSLYSASNDNTIKCWLFPAMPICGSENENRLLETLNRSFKMLEIKWPEDSRWNLVRIKGELILARNQEFDDRFKIELDQVSKLAEAVMGSGRVIFEEASSRELLINRRKEFSALLERALNKYRTKAYTAALEAYSSILEQVACPESYKSRGEIKLDIGDISGAIADFEQAIAIRRGNYPDAAISLAKARNQVANPLEAPKRPNAFSVISYKDIIFQNPQVHLGTGGFGVVNQATWQNVPVAVKQLKTKALKPETLQEFRNEAEYHGALRHPNIVSLYGVCIEAGHYCLVMELMLKQSLYHVLHHGQPLSWSLRFKIAKDITIGLAYLHSQSIVHRDLKSANVLLGTDFVAKLSDFGLSRVKREEAQRVESVEVAGTLPWMAPELLEGKPESNASDIYALGIVFWELASRERPYDKKSARDIKDEVVKGGRPRGMIPKVTPPKFGQLIADCWKQRREERLSAEKVLERLKEIEPPAEKAGASSDLNKGDSRGYRVSTIH